MISYEETKHNSSSENITEEVKNELANILQKNLKSPSNNPCLYFNSSFIGPLIISKDMIYSKIDLKESNLIDTKTFMTKIANRKLLEEKYTQEILELKNEIWFFFEQIKEKPYVAPEESKFFNLFESICGELLLNIHENQKAIKFFENMINGFELDEIDNFNEIWTYVYQDLVLPKVPKILIMQELNLLFSNQDEDEDVKNMLNLFQDGAKNIIQKIQKSRMPSLWTLGKPFVQKYFDLLVEEQRVFNLKISLNDHTLENDLLIMLDDIKLISQNYRKNCKHLFLDLHFDDIKSVAAIKKIPIIMEILKITELIKCIKLKIHWNFSSFPVGWDIPFRMSNIQILSISNAGFGINSEFICSRISECSNLIGLYLSAIGGQTHIQENIIKSIANAVSKLFKLQHIEFYLSFGSHNIKEKTTVPLFESFSLLKNLKTIVLDFQDPTNRIISSDFQCLCQSLANMSQLENISLFFAQGFSIL